MTKQQRKFYLYGVLLILVPSNGVSVVFNEKKLGYDVFVTVAGTDKTVFVSDKEIETLSAKSLGSKITSTLKVVT